jgi:hypothetical protein
MARFFLHCHRGSERRRDYEGAEFPDIDAALKNAAEAARLIAEEGLELGDDRTRWSLIVADEEAREIGRVELRNAAPAIINRH